MKNYIRVFDNGGKTWDRYTVVIYEDDTPNNEAYTAVFGMSSNAKSPQGFNQYLGSGAELPAVLEALQGKKTTVGKEMELTDLPQEVREAIGERLHGNS